MGTAAERTGKAQVSHARTRVNYALCAAAKLVAPAPLPSTRSIRSMTARAETFSMQTWS